MWSVILLKWDFQLISYRSWITNSNRKKKQSPAVRNIKHGSIWEHTLFIYCLFNEAIGNPEHIASNEWTVLSELEAAVVKFKVFLRHLPGNTGEKFTIAQSGQSVSQPKLEPATSKIQIRSQFTKSQRYCDMWTHFYVTLGKQARNKYSSNNRVDPLLGNAHNTRTQQ
jgi:hypothetical protein